MKRLFILLLISSLSFSIFAFDFKQGDSVIDIILNQEGPTETTTPKPRSEINTKVSCCYYDGSLHFTFAPSVGYATIEVSDLLNGGGTTVIKLPLENYKTVDLGNQPGQYYIRVSISDDGDYVGCLAL
jgi:hypothetical protein